MEKNKHITFTKVTGNNGKWRVQVSLFGLFFVISNSQMKFRSNNNLHRCDEKNMKMKFNLMKERGNHCELCGQSFSDSKMELHHKKPQSQYPELRYEPSNIMLLCHDCHAGLHNEVMKKAYELQGEYK